MKPVVKLTRGPLKQSQLILALSWLHVFVWAPRHGGDSFGTTVRWRRGRDWLHVRLVLCQRNAANHDRWSNQSRRESARVYMRRTVTVLEIAQWRTVDGTTARAGIKRYVRLKVGPGGRTEPLTATQDVS